MSAPPPGTAALNARQAGALIGALVAGGVRDAVISPGSRNTPVVLALHALSGAGKIRLHTVLDERAAGFFALGLARVLGRAVLLSCTSGSAGGHWLPALIEASEAKIPLIALTADRPAELQGFGAAQTVDQTRMFGGFVRLWRDLSEPAAGVDPRWLAAAAAQALDAATGACPGPVHINLPFREPLWDLEAELLAEPPPARVIRGPALPGAAEIDALAARLAGVERGVVVCGPRELAEDRARGGAPLRERVERLAERLGWPLIAEPASQLRFGAGAVSGADALLRAPKLAAALAPERALRFGRAPTSKTVGLWLARYGVGRTTLVEPAGMWLDPSGCADEVVAADPAALAEALLERLPQREGSWRARWGAADQAAGEILARHAAEGHWEGALAWQIAGALPGDVLLHVASSMPIRDLDAFAPPRGPLAVAANRGANGIDGLASTVMGEAAGGERVVALTGDLSFLHDLSGLMLAAQSPGRAVFVVIDNGGGGIFSFLPIGAHPSAFREHFLTPQAASIPQLCAGLGLACMRCERASELPEVLSEALAREGVSVVYVPVDREENLRRHRELWAELAELGEEVLG